MGRGSDDGSASAFSLPSRAAAGRARRGSGGGGTAAVNEDALLALRDECQQVRPSHERAVRDKRLMKGTSAASHSPCVCRLLPQAKLRERAAEDKMRQCVAVLAA